MTAPPPTATPYTLRALVAYFLHLGTLGFGGPIALVGYMQRDLVETRRWISLADFKEGLALAQLAPGPLAAQLAIYLGWLHHGEPGATLVAFAFVLPFLPLYVRQLGVQDEHAVALWAGVLIGVSPLLAGLLAPAWGRLADRYGHKRMAARALVSYVIILMLASAVTNVWQLLATRIGIGGFLAPFLFVYQPALLMKGDWTEIVLAFVSAAIGISALCASLAGHMFTPLGWPARVFLAAVSLAAISPDLLVSVATSLVLLAFGAWNWWQERQHPVTTAVPTVVVAGPAAPAPGTPPPTVME